MMRSHRSLTIFFLSSFVAGSPLTEAFGVTLDDAWQAAFKRSDLLAQSREEVVQAEERVRQARSGVLPRVSLEGSYLRQDQPSDALVRSFSPTEQTQVGVKLTQPLFRGFREFAALRQQKSLLASERQRRIAFMVELCREVAANFYSVLSFEQDLMNLDAQAELSRARVQELKGRVRTGESSESEILTAQSAEASVHAEREMVRGSLKTARERFEFLTGLGREASLTGPDSTSTGKPPLALTDALKHVARRPEIRAAEERLKAAGESLKISSGEHLPTADLTANYYFLKPEGLASDISWDVRLEISMPIYQGGLTKARVSEAASAETVARIEVWRLKRIAEQEVRSSHEELASRRKQLAVLGRALELAERNYRVVRTDYRRGLVRNLDVQLAMNDLRIARRALDQARYSAELERIRLDLAAGIYPFASGEAGELP